MATDTAFMEIRESSFVIGDHASDDYAVAPTEHAALYADRAPQFASILQSPAVAAAAETFERFDAKAIERQRRFKSAAHRANILVFGTAVCSALVVASGVLRETLGPQLAQSLAMAAAIAALIIGAAASAHLYGAKNGSYLTKWMRTRAEAEAWRVRYFEEITAGIDHDGTPYSAGLLLQKLQYFVRYQLSVQLAYYDRRGSDHERSAARSLRLAAVAIAISAIVTGVAGLLVKVDLAFVALGAVGVVASALTAFASARDSINQDQRNAERYERTFETLTKLNLTIAAVQRAVVETGPKPMADFVDAVHEQLSLEHRQWLDDAALTSKAMQALERTLEDARRHDPQAS